MFKKIAKHRANDASNDVHRPPLVLGWWLWSRSAKVNPLNSPLLNLLTAALPVIGMWTVSVQVAKVLVSRKKAIL